MSSRRSRTCPVCGAEIAGEVPGYYIEIESYRRISEFGEKIPRRGSKEYHEAMDKLRSEIEDAYYKDGEMYDNDHLWCSVCGSRMDLGSIGET